MQTVNLVKDPNPGLSAAREGRSFFGYVNAKTGIDTEAVLSDGTFIKPVYPGKRLVLSCFYMYLSTVSDNVTVDFVVTENPDGSGLVTALTPKFRQDTPAAMAQVGPTILHFDPPLIASFDDGQALSARVLGNDGTAALTLGMWGWEEDIPA